MRPLRLLDAALPFAFRPAATPDKMLFRRHAALSTPHAAAAIIRACYPRRFCAMPLRYVTLRLLRDAC